MNWLSMPNCLHVSGHSRYSKLELASILKFKQRHPEMELNIIKGQEWLSSFEEPDANIAARNLLLVDIAAHYGDIIYLICQLGEQSTPDRSPNFFLKLSELLTYLYGHTKTVNPGFPAMTKQDMVKEYLDRDFPVEDLWKTYSCFSSNEDRCGQCAACFRTMVALDYNNILPDKFFGNDILKWDGISLYRKKLLAREYDPRRTAQIIKVLTKNNLW